MPIMFNWDFHQGKRRTRPVAARQRGKQAVIPARSGRIEAESLRRFEGANFPSSEPIRFHGKNARSRLFRVV